MCVHVCVYVHKHVSVCDTKAMCMTFMCDMLYVRVVTNSETCTCRHTVKAIHLTWIHRDAHTRYVTHFTDATDARGVHVCVYVHVCGFHVALVCTHLLKSPCLLFVCVLNTCLCMIVLFVSCVFVLQPLCACVCVCEARGERVMGVRGRVCVWCMRGWVSVCTACETVYMRGRFCTHTHVHTQKQDNTITYKLLSIVLIQTYRNIQWNNVQYI